MSYQVQTQPSWCGPTELAVILGYKGLGWGGTAAQQQSGAASLLGVTGNGPGTPWYGSDNVPNYPGGSWYPMQDALNYKMNYLAGWDYSFVVQALPSSPSAADETTFRNGLVDNIANYSMPFAGNEYAGPYSHIGKQPNNSSWIYHWIAPNGYSASGTNAMFEDSGWGGGTVSSDTTHRVVVALGGRGYVY